MELGREILNLGGVVAKGGDHVCARKLRFLTVLTYLGTGFGFTAYREHGALFKNIYGLVDNGGFPLFDTGRVYHSLETSIKAPFTLQRSRLQSVVIESSSTFLK